jgi:hypothetical protein
LVVRQFAQATRGLLAGNNQILDPNSTDNNMELKKQVEEKKLPRMAKVHHVLAMWPGSQTLRATQQASRAENTQMTAVGYILDTEEIIKASCQTFIMIVRLHLNCRKSHLCHQLCPQKTSLEDKLKY